MVGKDSARAGSIAKRQRQDGDRRRDNLRAEVHGRHRRLVRRRQLLDVRPGVLAAVPVDVAERPHLGDGRRAGGVGARDRQARPARRQGRGVVEPRPSRRSRSRSARSTTIRAARTTRRRGCGTTASSTPPTPARCSPWRSSSRAARRCPSRRSGSSACSLLTNRMPRPRVRPRGRLLDAAVPRRAVAGQHPGRAEARDLPSDASASAGSSVNGAGCGPFAPVSTCRVVRPSPTNTASTAGTWIAMLPGEWPGSPTMRARPAGRAPGRRARRRPR